MELGGIYRSEMGLSNLHASKRNYIVQAIHIKIFGPFCMNLQATHRRFNFPLSNTF